MDKLKPTTGEKFAPLSDKEINDFFDDLDHDKDGYVTFEELEKKLTEVHDKYMPKLQKHHILHPYRRDIEKDINHRGDGLHAFLYELMKDPSPSARANPEDECPNNLNRQDFTRRVKHWNVPSQKQTDSQEADEEDRQQEQKIPKRRRLRAYWAVHGANILFCASVVALVLAIGLWQGGIYITNARARAALGWGVIMAKLSAGAIYPIFVFMLLSMSRHLGTFLRRNYHLSRFVNWDHSQRFHIILSCAGLVFATLHAIGHLTGSFLFGSRPEQQPALATYLGPGQTPKAYINFVRTLPGWSGITSLGLFWTISLLSMPFVRSRSYELFQVGHLLMFPLLGLLCAHGTAAILQAPMFGYWIAFPFLLVILERSWRLIRGFMKIPAVGQVLDDDAIVVTCTHPRGKDWRYSAGQYILLQVPAVSFFQWHPFTVSACRGNELSVHIKVEGSWTSSLRDLLLKDSNIKVGVDGPFGAPAQRFYDYDRDAIIIGGGIGITPFAAILNDLEEHMSAERDPWAQRRQSRSISRRASSVALSQISTPVVNNGDDDEEEEGTKSRGRNRDENEESNEEEEEEEKEKEKRNEKSTFPPSSTPRRRIDFHWTVREKNNLLWFSDLLNRTIIATSQRKRQHNNNNPITLNINTHITARRADISSHIFRCVLDRYKTAAAPVSALTGLRTRSSFGRPDFEDILQRHFDELVLDIRRSYYPGGGASPAASPTAAAAAAGDAVGDALGMGIMTEERKVGVFYCGTPIVGEILADTCYQLTARARAMGLKVRYDFLMEVFG